MPRPDRCGNLAQDQSFSEGNPRRRLDVAIRMGESSETSRTFHFPIATVGDIRNNPRDVRFDDPCRIAIRFGFIGGAGNGSHRAFSCPGEPTGLNFQNGEGNIPSYRAYQLIATIDKYEEES